MTRLDSRSLGELLRDDVAGDAAAAAARFAERAEHDDLVQVAYAPYDSPFGPGHVAATRRGIVAIRLPRYSEDAFLEQLAGGVSPRVLELPARLDDARRELDEYFAGERQSFDLPLDWSLVRAGFAGRVLRATAKLPFGSTSTYGEIAARAGNPRAFRAAGTALGSNPIPIVVPCHRVLRAGGLIGDYGGGPEMKEGLLRLEGALT
jgi:methylated-DNA-[protein]-cysteine S-methyltransferase